MNNANAYASSTVIGTGGTAQQLQSPGTGPGADIPQGSYIVLKARKNNTSPLYVGNSNAVTASTGFELQPGDITPLLPIGALSKAWIIGATTNDRYDLLTLGP